MSSFREGSIPTGIQGKLGKQDEELRERHTSQMQSSSHSNQDENFSELHSPLMHMSSENKIRQQQQPQKQQQRLSNGAPFRQGYPTKDDYPLNHQSSLPDVQKQQSSTKMSSQEHSSKQLLAEETSLQEHPPEAASLYDIRHQLPSGGIYSPPESNYPQPCGKSSDPSKQGPSPISAPPPKSNHPRESHQSSHQQFQHPSPVTAPSERYFIEDDDTASFRNSKHLQQQQPSDYSQGQPTKQGHPSDRYNFMEDYKTTSSGNSKRQQQPSDYSHVQPTKQGHPSDRYNFIEDHTTKSSGNSQQQQQLSDCSNVQPTKQAHPPKDYSKPMKEFTNNHDPPKPQSSSIKGPPAALKSESVIQRTVTDPKNETSTEREATHEDESSYKNVGVKRTESSSGCNCCSIL
ncbi:hypothetical protein PTKIN_Ptkin16aG0483900 [Pterospermum kingtungense]